MPERLKGVEEGARAGWKTLTSSGCAVDAVETAAMILEENPLFNAGTGSAMARRHAKWRCCSSKRPSTARSG